MKRKKTLDPQDSTGGKQVEKTTQLQTQATFHGKRKIIQRAGLEVQRQSQEAWRTADGTAVASASHVPPLSARPSLDRVSVALTPGLARCPVWGCGGGRGQRADKLSP